MEALLILAVLVIALVMFDAAAVEYGADSREQLPDAHRR
jgi:hypothetical protein